ncbi:hypothetical protein HRG84_11175 [Flavisolibacter sp. BT320]|nr:hypothetical protein [Flavisolibacter longurius]
MKQESIAFDKKTTLDLKTASERMTVAGTILTIGAAVGIATCLFVFWQHALLPFVLAFVFFLAGLVHVVTLRRGIHSLSPTGVWIYTLVATGIIVALLFSAKFWGPEFPVYIIVSAAAAFLFPFTVNEMWLAQLEHALEGARVWQPGHEMETAYPSFYFNATPMRFRVLQGNGFPQVTLSFKVSNELSLGKIFFDLAANKSQKTSKPVSLADEDHNLFHWVFFTSDSLVLTRPLDPEKTLAENGLTAKEMIYVQKVSAADFNKLMERPKY